MSVDCEPLTNGNSLDPDGDGFTVQMEGGGPWGFSLQGGADFRSPLRISRVSGWISVFQTESVLMQSLHEVYDPILVPHRIAVIMCKL